ncbi:hypothetical protein [Natronospora cellulosivora (SeqCode)]
MEFKGFKLNIIIVVFLLVIAVFFAGRYYYNVFSVERPIVEEILALDAVDDISLIEKQGKMDVIVKLIPGSDFFKTYQEIDIIMDEKLNNNRGNITIENHSTGDLEDLYYKLHYALYEGVNNKSFVAMEERINNIVIDNNIKDYRLWVDTQAVYLQLNNENSSFYKRIPYNTSIIVESEGGGQYA